MDNNTLQAINQARQARLQYRAGLVKPTAGIAPSMAQCNMISLPSSFAWDFLLYAQRNPKACPILDVIEAGGHQTILAQDADLRTDIPLYRIWQDGKLSEELTDVSKIWSKHPDLVTFLIGCSFSFEGALLQAGIEIRHISENKNVPMYITQIACRPAGKISGTMVVSMRPIAANRVADAVQITGRYPAVHGAPVNVGDPSALGIKDINKPDFGDSVTIKDGEIPVFWACGVTPQAAVMASKIPFAITHAPGYMFVTDTPDFTYHV